MPSVLDQLQARVQRALANFPELRRQIPAAELRSPAHLRAWISAAAALDKKGAQRASFGELSEAVEKWQAAAGLVDRAQRLYNDPRVIAMAGDKRDFYLNNPAAAYAELIASAGTGGRGLAGERDRQLRHELALAFRESMDLQTEFGLAEAREGPAPLPADPGQREAEYKALINESVEKRRNFPPEKRARLEALASVIAGATPDEAAAHRKALGIPEPTKPTGEYKKLIDKSVSGRLSETETARMEELATDRAAAAGLFESEGTQQNDDDV